MNKYMRFMTPYCDFFIVELDTGNMTQYKFSETNRFSGQWKFKGFRHVKKNTFISLEEIRTHPEILDEITLRYKNGNPQYTVVDLDYGTTRMWGNTKVHGVLSISLTEKEH